MASLFTRIIAGEIPCAKVFETDTCLAFLDIRPLKRGHTLVIPKKEVDYLYDLEEPLYVELQKTARTVAIGLKKAIPCKRIGVMVCGLEVPHAHIHLIPMDSEKDLSFSNPRLEISAEELESIAEVIRLEF